MLPPARVDRSCPLRDDLARLKMDIGAVRPSEMEERVGLR